jgi:hypothetical protein
MKLYIKDRTIAILTSGLKAAALQGILSMEKHVIWDVEAIEGNNFVGGDYQNEKRQDRDLLITEFIEKLMEIKIG